MTKTMPEVTTCNELRGEGLLKGDCCVGCHQLAADHANWLHVGTLEGREVQIQVCCAAAKQLIDAEVPVRWASGGRL